jgi:hypothetical protein
MGPIEQLKGEISKRGLANPNRFSAKFGVPGYVSQQVPDLDLSRPLDILCESISFPGKQIETVDYSMYRNPLKIPSGFINDEVSVTFRLTEDFLVKRVFEVWQGGIIDQNSYKARYLEEYVQDIEFTHQDKQDKSRYSIKLIDCYPITVGSIEKSHETTNTTLKVTVTFAVRDVIANNNLHTQYS